jgi:hypothetical protein
LKLSARRRVGSGKACFSLDVQSSAFTYGETVARELFPDVLPYVVGTPATYGFATRNGQTLADNAPEVMLSLVTATAVPSGLKPSVAKAMRDKKFPYVVPA